ncbi:protein asteroid [Culicoides brevitarsis]|uniref:protein asteroid n=1 Tax=Culicoides brevitarsis TaxID=469753 RepID=UPI00307C685A
MGVRGLTTYIAKNAEQYLVPFELHDCNLVIDGDNLASQLFNKTHNSAFGGNYDEYYKAVLHFFALLRSCNVTPFVLMDGGYEERKMRTIKARLQTRITSVKYALPLSSKPVIPLFMREVFLDAVRMSKVPIMRCMFEADDEIAVLARKLECPVLSYDSDFYIHNVMYIPYVTLTHKIYKKVMQDEKNYEIEVIGNNKGKKKSTKKVVVVGKNKQKSENNEIASEEKEIIAYQYLDCCLYTIESLVGGKKALNKEMLPLFATLIGNDFIERRVFRKFYSNVKQVKGRKKTTPQQKRIKTIFEWLKNESLKSALRKVVGVMKLAEREKLIKQIKTAMDGYNNEISVAFDYFGFVDEAPAVEKCSGIDLESLINEPEVDSEGEESEDVEENEDLESENDVSDPENDEKGDKNEENDNSGSENGEKLPSDEEIEENIEPAAPISVPEVTFPAWLQEKFMTGCLPRFVVDLYAGRRYVNYPQVEDLTLDDANSISYPILLRLYAILHHPEKPTLWYMTRVIRYARFYYKKFDATMIPDVNFNPEKQKNCQQFHFVFEKFPLQQLFNDLKALPDGLRLYFLAILFWMSQSKLTTSLHLHSALLGVVAMYFIDRKFAVTHDETRFFKGYKKLLEEIKASPIISSEKTDFSDLNKSLSKQEAILVMEKLLTNFSVSQKFERRHADFDRSVVHVFSELQSVCLFLHTLNAVSNNPFPILQMSQMFHGMFLYNTFVNLKSRADPWKYVKEQIFKNTPNFLKLYELMFAWCEKFLPHLASFDKQRIKVKAVKPRKPNRQDGRTSASKEIVVKITQNDCVENAEEEESDDEFVDLNNKFYQLLKV